MKTKKIFKITIDITMTILIMILMSFQFTGQKVHEWFGIGMFILFVIHNILNWRWSRNILKGKYSAFRIIQTVINILLFLLMIVMMISGIMMSRYIFTFLKINNYMSLARNLHMACSYWMFILISLHLGMHWAMIINMFKKSSKSKNESLIKKSILYFVSLFISVYGIYAFIKHKFYLYMFLRRKFIFMDNDYWIGWYLLDHLVIMGFFICVSYYTIKIIRKYSLKREAKK